MGGLDVSVWGSTNNYRGLHAKNDGPSSKTVDLQPPLIGHLIEIR